MGSEMCIRDRLNKETFVLDLKENIENCPVVSDYPLSMIDGSTLEVSVEKNRSINELFKALSEQGLHVVSMRNKANRLEELFLDLVENNLVTDVEGSANE